MTPQQSWIWLLGFIVLPIVLGYTFILLGRLWLGMRIYYGKRVCLADIFQFWGFVGGLALMFVLGLP